MLSRAGLHCPHNNVLNATLLGTVEALESILWKTRLTHIQTCSSGKLAVGVSLGLSLLLVAVHCFAELLKSKV